MEYSALVRVEGSVRSVENGCGRGVCIELVLVVEGGDLEGLRDLASAGLWVDLGLEDINFRRITSTGDRGTGVI